MVPYSSLLLPVILAAVFVFIASSIIHMVLKYHNSSMRPLPDEARTLEALRAANLTRGNYYFPYCQQKEMNSPEMVAKYEAGPVGYMTIYPKGRPNMGKFLGLWMGYCLLVSALTALFASHTLDAGAHFHAVMHRAGGAAFMAFAIGILPNGIWKGQTAGVVLKEFFDGIIYAAIVGATFAWLWPK